MMVKLQSDWLTEGIFDFEHKKYVLMAYLQHINSQFSAKRLYPHLPDLKVHFDQCVNFQMTKDTLKTSFPKTLTGVNKTTLNLIYEDTYRDDSYLSELNCILDFAIPHFSKMLNEGTDLFLDVKENVKISPVGIVPLRIEEGYLFFVHAFEKMVTIFQYQLALYNEMKERYLKTELIESVKLGIGNTLAQIKIDLTRKNKFLPNPATYIIESKYDYPLHETLLPVAKKLMLKEINVA